MSDFPITEDDLHAYVDGALEAGRLNEVTDYLGRHPEVARRVDAMAAQRLALRAALAPIAEEPIPPELSLAHLIEARRRAPLAQWRSAAAAALMLGLGGAGGWFLHGATDAVGTAALAQEADASYRVYASDSIRPVELKAENSAELVSWASQRLQRPVSVPDLAKAGYRFMGGRLVATEHGPAVLFLYDDDRGTRLAVLMRPMQSADQNAPMAAHEEGSVAGYAWADKGLGYSLVAEAAPEILHPLADEVRRQARGLAAGKTAS